jgi:hypothetical protein
MQIIRSRPQTASPPPEWFTGKAYIDEIALTDTTWGEHVTDAEYNATPAEKP